MKNFDFSESTLARARDLRQLGLVPLNQRNDESASLMFVRYPIGEPLTMLWYIYCAPDCASAVGGKLEAAGITTDANAEEYMDELEPKLLRWQAEMLEVSARARADVRARAEAFVCKSQV